MKLKSKNHIDLSGADITNLMVAVRCRFESCIDNGDFPAELREATRWRRLLDKLSKLTPKKKPNKRKRTK